MPSPMEVRFWVTELVTVAIVPLGQKNTLPLIVGGMNWIGLV